MKRIAFLLLLATSTPLFVLGQCFSVDLGADISQCDGNPVILSTPLEGDSLNYLWSTGETTSTISVVESGNYILTVISANCQDSDTVRVDLLATPNAAFDIGSSCAGQTTQFVNNSTALDGATFNWSFGDGKSSPSDSFIIEHIYESGGPFEAILEINNLNGCISADTQMLLVQTTPEANLRADPVCRGENLLLINNSTALDTFSEIEVSVNGMRILEDNANIDTLILPFTDPDNYNIDVRIINSNLCSDTQSFQTDIFALPDVSFSGLKSFYCTNDMVDTLFGQPLRGGTFSGKGIQNISDTDESIAILRPRIVGKNLEATFQFTDANGCSNSISDTYEVAKHPELEIFELGNQYCIGDPEVTIYGNQSTGFFSGTFINEDSLAMDSMATFNPMESGNYKITYAFENDEGCSEELEKEVTVFGLPEFSLGSDTFLTPGNSLIIGISLEDPERFNFKWSNEANTQTIEVFNPGFYILTVKEKNSECLVSDTINVQLEDEISSINYKDKRLELVVFPNPFKEQFVVQAMTTRPNLAIDQKLRIKIYNSIGNLILIAPPLKLNAPQIVDTKNWPSGLYYLKFGDYSQRIVKN